VALDDFVWQHSGDADCGSEKETHSDAIAHGGFSRFLRLNDHAHRRAGHDHSSAAQSDSGFARRQQGTVGDERQGISGSSSARPGTRLPDPSPDDPGSNEPGAISFGSSSVYPDSINPGSINKYPVNPGSTATAFAKLGRKDCETQGPCSADPGSAQAGFRFNRSASRSDYDLSPRLQQ
jgi:hypothetical protein